MAESYPWPLLVLFGLLDVSISYPSPKNRVRKWILAPAMLSIAGYLYMQAPPLPRAAVSYAIGSTIAFRLCSMVNLVYAQPEFPDFWRRVEDGDQAPSTLGFMKKVAWMLDSAGGARRVGWVQEPTGALPPRPKSGSKLAFVATRMFHGVIYFFLLDLIVKYQTGNPAFDPSVHPSTDGPEAYIQGQPLLWRVLNFASWGMSIMSGLNLTHGPVAAISVFLGQSEPRDWPHMFGSFTESYTLRHFWGKSWHQTFRPPMTGIAKSIAHKGFRFAPGTNMSAYTQLYIVFLISGLIHAGGDYMVLRHLPMSTMRAFLLQAVAITLEDFVIWCTQPIRPKLGVLSRAIGFIWVVVWITCLSGPPWVDSMSVHGYGSGGTVFRLLIDVARNNLSLTAA